MADEISVNIETGEIIVVELSRGYSGYSGKSGFSGYSGANPGASGYSGYSGKSGYSGISGKSGYSGASAFSGYSGRSAYSGYSGVGTSGFSGYSGTSGFSGYSGISTVLASTSLNLNTNTKQTLYTVPGGKSAIIIEVVLRGASVNLGGGITSNIQFGFNAGANDWTGGGTALAITSLTTSGVFTTQDFFEATGGAGAVRPIGTAAQTFGAITDAAFGSAATVTVDVIGYTF